MQGTLQNYIAIFKQHVAVDQDLLFFAYGEIFEINNRLKSDRDFKIPMLWLDEPVIVPNRNSTNLYTNTFNSAYWVIVKLPNVRTFENI